jgi:hypothetical protein
MISYRSKDSGFINLLQQYLEGSNIMCWRDRRMEVGSNWSEDITNAVRTSRCVITCISENYLKSSLCTKEIRLGHEMNKIIIPLVLPQSQEKPKDKLVDKHYSSLYPPHTVAREIAKTTWVDFRPLGNPIEPDPIDIATFEKRFGKLLKPLRDQLLTVKSKGTLWKMDGKWKFIFEQEEDKDSGVEPKFEADIEFTHHQNELNGKLVFTSGGYKGKTFSVISEASSLDCSSLKFEFADEANADDIFSVSCMLSLDGEKLDGAWFGVDKGDWCQGEGDFSGKLVEKRKKEKKPAKDVKGKKPVKK